MKKIITAIALIALVAVLGCMFIACGSGSSGSSSLSKEDAKAKLEKAGYTVEIAEAAAGGMDYTLTATKDGESLVAYHFTDGNAKKTYYDTMKLTGAADLYGDFVLVGSDDAIKAFKA